MAKETDNNDKSEPSRNTGIGRRRILRFGTVASALTGASALSALSASSAAAGPGDKTPPNTYVPVAEKGSPSGVASLDANAKVLAAQLPDFSAAYALGGILTPEQYGAVGDGLTDDTAALNAALAESAVTGKWVLGNRLATYKVGPSGTQSFTTGTGSTFIAPYCVRVPSLAKVDFQMAKLATPPAFNGVALCNENTTGIGDTIELKNLLIDGGGKSSGRGYPLFVLYGLNRSNITNVSVGNTSYIAGSIGACTNSQFRTLKAHDIRGQGIMLGNGESDLNKGCTFTGLEAWNIASFGTFSQPGNGFCVGATSSLVEDVRVRNCAGGIKYLKGSDNVNTFYAEFDGTIAPGETDNNTANSGIKVQGDDDNSKTGMISFDKIVARFCGGSGLYVRFAKRVRVTSYVGYKNGRLGLNDDIDAAEFEDFEVDNISSENAGSGGVTITTNGAVYRFGRVTIRDFGDVSMTSAYGFSPLQGKGRINNLEIYDDRVPQVASKAIHGINDVPLSVDNYRTNIGNRVDIRSCKIFLGNPVLSTGNSALTGHVTLTAAAQRTDVTNSNCVSQAAGVGWAEPIIEIIPMNSAAQALGAIRCSIPSNYTFRIHHATAGGGEVFGWRVVGYTWRSVKPA